MYGFNSIILIVLKVILWVCGLFWFIMILIVEFEYLMLRGFGIISEEVDIVL